MSAHRPTASLRALLHSLIDYAGLYPPAALSLEKTVENYRAYLASEHCWMLSRLVLPVGKLSDVHLRAGWRVTLLAEEPVENLPPEVETVETKGTSLFPRPTYREMPLAQIQNGWAKVRTGALVAEGIPSAETLADFLMDASQQRMAFKATAGLHHPLRSERALTYAPDSPRAVMHGFVNVFVAAAFAWHGAERSAVLDLLQEEDRGAFAFREDALEWRGRRLSTAEVQTARREFAHSFGSCSFEEPVEELQGMGWL